MRRALAIALAVLPLGWLLGGGVATFALTHRWGAKPGAERLPGGAEVVALRTSDGLSVRGHAFDAHRDDGVAVLVLHGHHGSRTKMARVSRVFRQAGHAVMAVSLRSHGDSEGELDDIGFGARRDVVAAVADMRARWPGRPIVLYGASMGAAAALYAAPALGDSVAAYVLAAPFASLREAVSRRCDRFLPSPMSELAFAGLMVWAPSRLPPLERLRPEASAASVPRSTRLRILVGEEDWRAPPSDAEAIVRAAGHGEVVRFPGLGHEDLVEEMPGDWRNAVLPLLDEL